MPNALTRHVGLNAGTWVLETLVKHYFEQLFKDKELTAEGSSTNGTSGDLRRDELLYDETFHIVKSFLEASTYHTVEELQQFSNVRTPSPPWMHVMRVLVPMAWCDEAATYLIEALGGEEKTKQVVGGTKWWQVRGIKGVDAQWIIARKDYHQAVKRRKQQEQAEKMQREASENAEEDVYSAEMDELRCILYCHGGGYYFGSVDQERYFIQRFARKSGCRLLAINYRLAPQYPFPCAIQDALAAYLYLIRPPPGARHRPVNPAHIVISGDSAGGGLTFALLQVIRDSKLPLPAGGVLISPWADLTHSFPSVHTNTDTDVMPPYGLSVYKPSALWPPPSEDLTEKVQHTLRSRVLQIARKYSERGGEKVADADDEPLKSTSFWRRKLSFTGRGRHTSRSVSEGRARSPSHSRKTLADGARAGDVRAAAVARSQSRPAIGRGEDEDTQAVELGAAAPLPEVDQMPEQTLSVITEVGEKLEVHDQVHMYAPNNLLAHPLVSPAFSYLGGLPPLLIIASDSEVLRDEVIYSAHKAAHPERYPVKSEAKHLYPVLEGIESRHGPTQVHLQVYDQAAHVLPVLFSFCTPAKFCFRAMASFNRYVLGTLPPPILEDNDATNPPSSSKLHAQRSLSASIPRRMSMLKNTKRRSTYSSRIPQEQSPTIIDTDDHEATDHVSQSSTHSSISVQLDSMSSPQTDGLRFAGDPTVYSQTAGPSSSPFMDNMIRERVSIRGKIRSLEPESDLTACNMPIERLGIVGELALRRYIEGRTKWDEKFASAIKRIRRLRAQHLDTVNKATVRNVAQLQMHFFQNGNGETAGAAGVGVKEGLRRSAASWAWAWALDGAERPPPSSIVARRDTDEARRLSRIADQPADAGGDHRMSGNNLWSFLVNRLSLEKTEAQVEHGSDDPVAAAVTSPEQPDAPSVQAAVARKSWRRSNTRPSTGTATSTAGRMARRFKSASAMTSQHQRDELQAGDSNEFSAAELGVLGRVRSH